MPLTDGAQYSARPRLLVYAAPHRWSDLLRTVEPYWDLDWVSGDEQFVAELARHPYPVALCEEFATLSAAATESTTFTKNSTQFLKLCNTAPEFGNGQSPACLGSIHPLTSPNDLIQWLYVAREVSRISDERSRLQRRLALRRSPIVGGTAAIERLRLQVASAALHDWPILIQGEPGTGRDLVAGAIHEAGDRAHRPLVKINCRVHTAVSLERELFGQVASRNIPTTSAGRFDLADGGVVILDAIDEVSLPLQCVLARVLETKSFQRLGEPHMSPLTARVIAISTRNLLELTEAGGFREDLYRHFAGPVLVPPPLREIRADIAPLTEHLLLKVSRRLGEAPRRLLIETLQRLQAYDWPGNARELEQLLERACTVQQGTKLTPEMVDAWLQAAPQDADTSSGVTLAQMERQLIEATFARCAGNRELTAQTLQIGLRTLSGKLREYGYPPRGGPGSNQLSQQRDAA